MGDSTLLHDRITDQGIIENGNPLRKQLSFHIQGKKMRIKLDLIALFPFLLPCSTEKPGFWFIAVRPMEDGEPQQFFADTKTHLSPLPVTKGQINGNQASSGKPTDNALSFYEQHPDAFPRSSYRRGNSGNTASSHQNVIFPQNLRLSRTFYNG